MTMDELEDMGTVAIEDIPSCTIDYSYTREDKRNEYALPKSLPFPELPSSSDIEEGPSKRTHSQMIDSQTDIESDGTEGSLVNFIEDDLKEIKKKENNLDLDLRDLLDEDAEEDR